MRDAKFSDHGSGDMLLRGESDGKAIWLLCPDLELLSAADSLWCQTRSQRIFSERSVVQANPTPT